MMEELVVTRTFNVPRVFLFKMWTDPDHLKHWWGPKGTVLKIKKLELKPEGIFLYSSTTPDGQDMWGKFVFKEISAPNLLVFTNSFSDSEGNAIRAPFHSDWPLEILNTLTFSEKEGESEFTIRGNPIGATEEELNLFVSSFASLKQGFNGTFDQLDSYMKDL
ncbi:MAG TPA: SRPBCC domain-containing protein [Bacillales bacterium]|nr:SRPBCC domain-containing protein [Bacillales bacterium]